MNRIISLFLFIFIASCLNGQYNSPIKNKVTLGVQTSADGLVWRGRLADTANLLTNKLDTSVYIVLDTGTRAMWYYRASTTPKWTRLVDSLNNLQGQLSLTTKVTGVLPVVNGGTGTGTAFTAGSVVFAGTSGTSLTEDNSGLFFNATSNRLGIGTASPAYALDVIEDNEPSQTNTFAIARFTGSNTTANDLSIIGPSGSQVRLNFGRVGRGQDGEMGYNNNTRAFRLVSAGLETARFDSLQRVGIGTTGPTARLHVKGSGVDGNTTALKVDNNGNVNLLTILDNGFVGIGTPTPTTQMQLVGSTFSIIRVSSGAGSVSRFDFGTQSSPDIGRLTFSNADSSIRIRPGLEASELSLLKNGNLGISIATPTQKLHVAGNGLFTGSITANSLSLTTPLSVANGGTGENMSSLPNNYLIRKNSSGIFDTAAIFESGGNVGIGTNAPTNNLSILGSGIAVTRLLIDGNGCQGTTPSGCITDLVLRRTTGRGFAFQILSDSLTDTNFNVESTVSGANQMRLRTDSNLSGMNFINGSSTAPIRFIQDLTPRLIINSGGEILIGYQSNQDNGAYRLQVNSQIFATNATIATSDIKFKENIQPLDKGLEIINKLKPVKFNFITTTENNFSEFDEIGFIAQDVEGALSTELFAKAVVKKLDENKDDSALGLMTEKFIPILVKAIQEQQALIKALEQRIINLENK